MSNTQISESARKKFEEWVSSPPLERSVERWPDDQHRFAWPNQYRDIEVQLAFDAWCESQSAINEATKEKDALIEIGCRDWAEAHTHAQNVLRKHGFTEQQIEGDKYGVPGIEGLVDLLDEKITALRPMEVTVNVDASLRSEVERLKKERDSAVKEANRRDEKWMAGIREVCGCEIEFHMDSSCKALTFEKFVRGIQSENASLKSALREATGFIEDAEDDDCDEGAHGIHSPHCRACEAKRLLSTLKPILEEK